MKKIIYLLLISVAMLSCDKDKFGDINTNSSTINDPEIQYVLTGALENIDVKTEYIYWFYNSAQYMFPWTQTTVAQGGNEVKDFKNIGPVGSYSLYNKKFPNLFEVRHLIKNLKGKERVRFAKINAVTYPIQILNALKQSDMYGAMAYSEAMQGKYTNPPLLTPKYDSQEELFNTWIAELDNAIINLKKNHKFEGVNVSQISLDGQDFIYGGNYDKWAKFANSLKLRIAVRLLNQDKAKALKIVNEAIANTAGLITERADEMLYNRGIRFFNFGGGIWFGNGSRHLINFLTSNKDPRVRFIFDKNDFNSKVIGGIIKDSNTVNILPVDIRSKINIDILTRKDKSKIKCDSAVFNSWKIGQGEPWCRYVGAPACPDSTLNPITKKEYFNSDTYKVGDKRYTVLSRYSEKRIRPNLNITYPDPYEVSEDKTDSPYNSVVFSAAEVNLYLAELKLLGANVTGSAEDFYKKGVRLSIESMDNIAKKNGLAYYEKPYDNKFGKSIKLVDGEIDNLLNTSDYKFDGINDLEKVYIQQYIAFLDQPSELYVTVRRSGYPAKNSTILALPLFNSSGVEVVMPRRFEVRTPVGSNPNYDNLVKAYKDQNYTTGSNINTVLNSERIWYDKKAPKFGAGK